MRSDKEKAVQMRKKGLSYKIITKKLSIPKSTLSEWFSGLGWSQSVTKKLVKTSGKAASIAQKKRWTAWRKVFRDEAEVEFKQLASSQVFIMGVCLYWGEGNHHSKQSQVRLVNTDYRLVKIFLVFLRRVAKIPEEKIKIELTLYDDLSRRNV